MTLEHHIDDIAAEAEDKELVFVFTYLGEQLLIMFEGFWRNGTFKKASKQPRKTSIKLLV